MPKPAKKQPVAQLAYNNLAEAYAERVDTKPLSSPSSTASWLLAVFWFFP
jgi:hypothetical protein